MAANSKIADYTFAPFRIRNGQYVVASEATWRKPARWNRGAADGRHRPRVLLTYDVFEDWAGPMVDAQGKTATIQIPGFVERPLLMQDVRVRVLRLICDTDNLDWLLLTKRPHNVVPMLRDAWMQLDSARDPDPRNSRPFAIPPNLWLGVSVENQQAADERIPHLLRVERGADDLHRIAGGLYAELVGWMFPPRPTANDKRKETQK